jgi:hypothetical protein
MFSVYLYSNQLTIKNYIIMKTDYNYIVGEEIVLFEECDEFVGVVLDVRDNTILCSMGDNVFKEFNKGDVVPFYDVEDLFDTPELIPNEVIDIMGTFDEDSGNTYLELDRLITELKEVGYTFSYYLDAEPYWLRKIK